MQDEDSELALQLDNLITQYNRARKVHGGSIESFWRQWWQVLNDILPPLLSIEACKTRLMQYRDPNGEKYRELDRLTIEHRLAREQEALTKAGYVGPEFEDFRQVIRVHFSGRTWNAPVSDSASSEDWETCSSDTDTYASESAHED
jgi:hypothetical protein